MYRTNTDKI